MERVLRARRESFGAVLYSEHPGFVAFLDHAGASCLRLPQDQGLPEHCLRGPLDAHVALTTRCNLACPGCYARALAPVPEDMPVPLARTVLNSLRNLGTFTVAFGGGEPFLHPALFDLAAYARGLGLVPNVTTNGTGIDAQNALKCRTFGAIHLSLHEPGERDRLAGAAAALLSAGVAPGLNILLGAATAQALEEVLAWAAACRFSRVLLLREKGPAGGAVAAVSDSQALAALWATALRAARRRRITLLADCSLFPVVARSGLSHRDLESGDLGGCRGGDHFLAVDVRGRFKPCSFWGKTFGEAARLTPGEWAHSEPLNAFRRVRVAGPCAACPTLELCRGGCRLPDVSRCPRA